MNFPENLRYTEDHEWAREEGGAVTVGVTDYAQQTLGEIVFVEMPSEGDVFKAGGTLGAVESTKAVSDIFCPVSGKVAEVNAALVDSPETINSSPYGEGWIVKIAADDVSSLGNLMDAAAYERFVGELE